MGAEFRENPAGVREMLAAPWMVAGLVTVVEPARATAERLTPVDTGRMRASWRIVSGLRDGRAWVRLMNTARNPKTGAPYPYFLEVGTRYIKKRRILGRAIDSIRR